MKTVPIISISIPDQLLEELDTSIRERGFANRSETIRHALRDFLSEYRSFSELEGEVLVTITIILRRDGKKERTFDTQHKFGNIISTFLHSHVDEKSCLEVLLVKGEVCVIKKLVDALKADEHIAQIRIATLGKTR